MKRQFRQRLRMQTNTQLAQSTAYINDRSIIHQLGDLIDEQIVPIVNNNVLGLEKGEKYINSGRIQKKSPNPYTALRNLRTKTDGLRPDHQNINLLRQRSKNRLNTESYNQSYFIKSHHKPSHFNDFQQKQKRLSLKDPSIFQSKKQTENSSLRIKFDYNRSNVIKNKQFVYSNLLKKCQHCKSIKSQVFRNNLVCRNKSCRLMHFFQDFQTFPLSGILYEIQTPSSSCQQLEELIKKIVEQIQKIQNWRNSLLQLQFQIQSMIQTRKEFQKYNKNQLRSFLNSITEVRSKRAKPSEKEIQQTIKKLQNLELRKVFEQFNRWNRVNEQKFNQSKTITDLIHKYKPLCLKMINSQIAGQVAGLTDNFNNTQVIIKSTQFLSYNFNGRLNKMTIVIDGSIQLKRDNFLLIQNLEFLRIIFQTRKTSRQLKQLFNILPNVLSISLSFDYKLHSHVSSQTFPLITKACEIAQKSLQVNLLNARPEVFQDIMQASKIIRPKQKLKICINMNPFIAQSQWPDYSKSSEWGTKLLKNLLKNVGNQVIELDLQLPFQVNIQQISEYLINSDSLLLIRLRLHMLNNQIQSKEQNINQLLHKIINKKVTLLGMLVNQKRQSSHPLNKCYRLAQSVYRVLF